VAADVIGQLLARERGSVVFLEVGGALCTTSCWVGLPVRQLRSSAAAVMCWSVSSTGWLTDEHGRYTAIETRIFHLPEVGLYCVPLRRWYHYWDAAVLVVAHSFQHAPNPSSSDITSNRGNWIWHCLTHRCQGCAPFAASIMRYVRMLLLAPYSCTFARGVVVEVRRSRWSFWAPFAAGLSEDHAGRLQHELHARLKKRFWPSGSLALPVPYIFDDPMKGGSGMGGLSGQISPEHTRNLPRPRRLARRLSTNT